ncbi:MAG: hypothetical protein Alpg2KO_09160 [Alphaproteobacteria bacterium]
MHITRILRQSALPGMAGLLLSVTMMGAGAGLAQAQFITDDEKDYVLTTASKTGTYYPVGVALSTLVKIKLSPKHQFTLNAETSAGSAENVARLRKGEAQFAIMEGLYGDWAWHGTGAMEESGKLDSIRSVAQLWPEVEHWVLRSDLATTGTMDDLLPLTSEQTLSIGPRNSGTAGSAKLILGGLGLDLEPEVSTTGPVTAASPARQPVPIGTPAMKPEEGAEDGTQAEASPETIPTPEPSPEPQPPFTVAYSSREQAVTDMLAGSIDGASLSAGLPVGDVTRLFEGASEEKPYTLLSFTEDQIARANDGLRLWSPVQIPAETYPGQHQPVTTIAQPNFMAVTADVSEAVVYEITRSMFENLEFLHAIHPATKMMSLDRAVAGLTVPLHPGAIRYYEERGVSIPDHLRPPAPVEEAPEPSPDAETQASPAVE